MRRIDYYAKLDRIKLKESTFWGLNLENYVIRDTHKVICNRNLRKIRRYEALSAILAHSSILALELL